MATQKKIIFSTYDSLKNPYYNGGGAFAIHQVAQHLMQEGDSSIEIITGKYPGCQNQMIDGVQYNHIGFSFLGPRIGQLIFVMLLPLYAMFRRYNVWIESFTPPFSSAFLPLFTYRPVIGVAHMLSAEDMERKYKLPIFKFIEKIGIRQYDQIVALTTDVHTKIKRISKRTKVHIIPNGIDDFYDPSIINAKEHVLFIGRIEFNQKGLDMLLEAFAKAAPNITQDLIIAGSGCEGDIKKMADRISDLKLENRVKFIGRATGIRKDELFRNALCVTLSSRFETLPFVALEALSYGTPLVCFDIDGFKWLPEENCVKIKSFDVDAYAEAIITLSKEDKAWKAIVKGGRDYAENFKWSEVVNRYKRLIRAA